MWGIGQIFLFLTTTVFHDKDGPPLAPSVIAQKLDLDCAVLLVVTAAAAAAPVTLHLHGELTVQVHQLASRVSPNNRLLHGLFLVT